MSKTTLRRIRSAGIAAALLGAVNVVAAPEAVAVAPDCGATGVKFTAGFVHDQWHHVEVPFVNAGAVPARCRVTLHAAKADGTEAAASPSAFIRQVPAGTAMTADFHLAAPEAGTYRVRACARAVRNAAVIDGNATNDCVVVFSVAS